MSRAPTKARTQLHSELPREEGSNRKRVAPRRDALPAAATRTTVVCRATRRTLHCWSTRRTPAARVGLHQTLATSRETIHPTQNALARAARPASPPIRDESGGADRSAARPPQCRDTGPRAAARPEPLAVPSTHWRAGGRPRPLWVPAVGAPCGARARPVRHDYASADSLGRARCSPATGAARIASKNAAPTSTFSLALLQA